MDPILNVEHLTVSFTNLQQRTYALRGVSFSLFPGEILGIVGESGSGKSICAKTIMKLLPLHSAKIDEGRVQFLGRDLTQLSEAAMRTLRGREIAMIFQDPMTSLNPTTKIGTQLIEGYRLHYPGISRADATHYATELLRLVGIPVPEERMHAYPHMLSGGMRQRTMIAMAMACTPKILLADEPTTALDVTTQAHILHLLKTITLRDRTSILLITHDLSVVAGICDRVLVMYAGKIVEEAPVERLFSQPRHPYTQGLLRAIPRIDSPRSTPLLSMPGRPPSLHKRSSEGCTFCPRCPRAMAICTMQEPNPQVIESGHTSSCWLEHVPPR